MLLDHLGRGAGTKDSLASLARRPAICLSRSAELLAVAGTLGLLVDQALQGEDDLGVGQDRDGVLRAVDCSASRSDSAFGQCQDMRLSGRRRFAGSSDADRAIGSIFAAAGRSCSARRLRIAVIFPAKVATVASAFDDRAQGTAPG